MDDITICSDDGKADFKLDVKEETWWLQNPSTSETAASNTMLGKEVNNSNAEVKEEPMWLKSEWENMPPPSPCLKKDGTAIRSDGAHIKTEVKEEPLWSEPETEIKVTDTLITGMDDFWTAQSPRLNTEGISNDGSASSKKLDCTTNEQEVDRNDTIRSCESSSSQYRGKGPHKCEVCDKRFLRASRLKEHSLIHEDKRPHVCETCQKSFRLFSHLKRHYLIHAGKRPYKCTVCEKTFLHATNLRIHSYIHEDKSPFRCDTCGKYFLQMSHLKTHKFTHDGSKPYKCKVCEKSFTQMSYLRVHSLVHEGKSPHKCDICRKSFNWMSHLKRHNSQVHQFE